ncbi:hypothetical protein DF186_24030, partial [Enterococcus hirae]
DVAEHGQVRGGARESLRDETRERFRRHAPVVAVTVHVPAGNLRDGGHREQQRTARVEHFAKRRERGAQVVNEMQGLRAD